MAEEMKIQDNYRIQDWMIWTIEGTEEFEVRDGAYHIVNGRHTLNRPLYGTNGPETVFAGDRPLILLSRGPTTKLGVLGAEILTESGRKRLETAERIEFSYDGVQVKWRVSDPLLGATSLDLAVVALADAPGFLVRVEAADAVHLGWWYGGLRGDYPDNRGGHGALPGGRGESDCGGNTVESSGCTAVLSNPTVQGAVVFIGLHPDGTWGQTQSSGGPAAGADVALGPSPVYVAVTTTREVLDGVLADPDAAWHRATERYERIANRLATRTPCAVLDAAMRGNNAAMDGQYRPPSFLHGALRWGTECGGWYLGWRGWYGPIVAGDFERVAGAARFHASYQLTSPEQGRVSRGKIANFVAFDERSDGFKTAYNMQEVFLDHLRSYYWWSGDHELMKALWPTIKEALEYQRREIGRGLNGLYTNDVNTWISDGHHYNGHACTQASAYAISHNRFAAQVAALTGEDASFYADHARQVRAEMNHRLWPADDGGCFAEYSDGDGVLHDAAEAPTAYHAVEMGAADEFQAYQMTRYIDERLWRFGNQILANDWFPVIVTNGLIGFNESLNTALAYYHAGRFERAWRLLEVCCASTAKATVPGSISCYGSREGAQGTYVDFTDASSMLARTVVEGLFGLQPRVDQDRVEWRPRFPAEWDRATLTTRGFSVSFERRGSVATYTLQSNATLEHLLCIPVSLGRLQGVTVNGREQTEYEAREAVLRPYIDVRVPKAVRTVVVLTGTGRLPLPAAPSRACPGEEVTLTCPGAPILRLMDPQHVFRGVAVQGGSVHATLVKDDGPHTAFVRVKAEAGCFWAPVDIECVPPLEIVDPELAADAGTEQVGLRLELRNNTGRTVAEEAEILFPGQTWGVPMSIDPGSAHEVKLPISDPRLVQPGHTTVTVRVAGHTLGGRTRLWRLFEALPKQTARFQEECRLLELPCNDALAKVFTRAYDVPNPPQLNNWTWYETGCINTDAMRDRAMDGLLMTRVGVPFAVSMSGNDGVFLSRWQPFERCVRIPVEEHADKLYLLLANHTHNSQTHMRQAEVVLEYDDSTETVVPLRGPRDMDTMLQHYSDMAPEWIGGEDGGWYGHGRATGVHADVTDIEVDPSRRLKAFELRCVTEETLVGLLGATVHRVEGWASP